VTPEKKEKTHKIRVRCKKATRIKFNVFVAENDFKDQEDAIETLLQMAKNYPDLVKKSKIRYL